jgi:hypothetical protein
LAGLSVKTTFDRRLFFALTPLSGKTAGKLELTRRFFFNHQHKAQLLAETLAEMLFLPPLNWI